MMMAGGEGRVQCVPLWHGPPFVPQLYGFKRGLHVPLPSCLPTPAPDEQRVSQKRGGTLLLSAEGWGSSDEQENVGSHRAS